MGLTRVTEQCADSGNAAYFVEHFGHRVRYVATWRKWIVWTGKAWRIDEGAAMRLAIQAMEARLGAALTMYADAVKALAAVEAAKSEADDAKKAVAKAHAFVQWARRSQDARRIQAVLTLAKCAEQISIEHTALDADAYLLNAQNGTIDLRTGALRPHDPGDLITKSVPVEYDPTATAPTWLAFLDKSLGGDVDLITFVRRFTGYLLTGDVQEHCMGFLFGGGGNGKSTYTRTTIAMLGDYAAPAPRSLLFRSRSERHPTELASLVGLRFAVCSEVEEGQHLDEAKLKDLTGGDPISARRMNEDFWSFDPTHKLVLNGNYKPRVSGTDEGIWRRIRLVPWTVQIRAEERDHHLPDKLRAELPGILAWSVAGCLEWQGHGLGEPVAVTKATEDYRAESDPLGEFFALRCVFDDSAKVARKMLRATYEEHCEENGAKPLDAKAFATRLRERGVEDGDVWAQGKTVNGWRGVRLRNLDTEPLTDLGTSVPLGSKCRSEQDSDSSRGDLTGKQGSKYRGTVERGAA